MFAPQVARRLAFLVLVLLGVSLITFLLSHMVPADLARLFAGPRASAATVEQLRHQLGFDLPVWQQYGRYLGGLLHGDFGDSLTSHRPVADDLRDYLPATIELTLAAIVIILVVGVPLGVISAVWHDSPIDALGRAISITGVAIPALALASPWARPPSYLPLPWSSASRSARWRASRAAGSTRSSCASRTSSWPSPR